MYYLFAQRKSGHRCIPGDVVFETTESREVLARRVNELVSAEFETVHAIQGDSLMTVDLLTEDIMKQLCERRKREEAEKERRLTERDW